MYCKKENGKFLIPDIPKEIQKCVLKNNLNETLKVIHLDFVSPCTKDKRLVVESGLMDVKCPPVVTEEENEESMPQNEDQQKVSSQAFQFC